MEESVSNRAHTYACASQRDVHYRFNFGAELQYPGVSNPGGVAKYGPLDEITKIFDNLIQWLRFYRITRVLKLLESWESGFGFDCSWDETCADRCRKCEFCGAKLCCGSCGYELNLSSSDRNTESIGSKYGKSIKRGMISFFNIDDSRFTQVDEIQCMPHFSKHSWGLFRRKTKLLCRKCGNHIGNAYNGYTSSAPLVSDATCSNTKYDIRIRALQPSSSEEEFGTAVSHNYVV